MMKIIPWLAVAGVVLFAGSAAANDDGYPAPGPVNQGNLASLRETVRQTGAPDDWITFLAAVGNRETGGTFNNLAENTASGEASAARRAYDRQLARGRFSGSPWPESAYTFGSGGWYGLIPANAMEGFAGTELENLDPRTAIHDPVTSTILAFEYARRIFGWAAFDGTWLGLRVGWANPSKMGDPDFVAEVAGRFRKDLEAVGASPSFMHERVVSMAGYPGAEALFYQMKGEA